MAHPGVPEVRQDGNAVHDAAQVASEGSQVQGRGAHPAGSQLSLIGPLPSPHWLSVALACSFNIM